MIIYFNKDVLDHLSYLKASDDLDFLLNTMYINEFLHVFYFQLILHNTNYLISNIIYERNRFFECVYSMVNFVLDLYTSKRFKASLFCFSTDN